MVIAWLLKHLKMTHNAQYYIFISTLDWYTHVSILSLCYLHVGDNVEELFTRIATTAFESVMMKEIEASLVPSNGQIARTSTLISTLLNRYYFVTGFAKRDHVSHFSIFDDFQAVIFPQPLIL